MSEQRKRLTDAEVACLYAGDPEFPAGTKRADHLQAREDRKRLVDLLRSFAETAEAAVAEQQRPKTGIQLPFRGDFAGITPSVASRLGWWARTMRALLAEVDPQ